MAIALLAALIGWAVTSGGSGGKKDDAKTGGSSPAPSITPGPSSSGPTVGQPPGGRDESDGSKDSGGSGGPRETGVSGASSGAGAETGADGSNGDTGSNEATGGGGSAGGIPGVRVPAGSALPNCTASALRLSLRTDISYGPEDKPKFRLIAENTSATDCKADLGPKNTVLTITEAGGGDDEEVWSSKDCPSDAAQLFLKIPAGTTVVHTVEWERRKSTPTCATPAPGKAGPGTYLLEAKAPGEPLQRASFVLAKD